MTWSDADDARLRALWDAGHSTAEIGRIMGRGKNSVVGRAHRMGLAARPTPIVSVTLTAAQDSALAQLAARRHSVRQIAARMGIGEATARRAMQRLGVSAAHGPLRRLNGAGTAAVRRATDNTERLRAEAFRRHAQPGGGAVSPSGSVAQTIPASAGVPVRAGYPEAPAGCGGLDVSSRELPPAVVTPRPAVFSGERRCRWPMWGDRDRATGVFCDAGVRLRRDGSACVYCAEHAARAYIGRGGAEMPPTAMLGGWRGAA